MSATQRRLGAGAVKSRSGRSGAGRARSSRRVVRQNFLLVTPWRSAMRMSRATWWRPTVSSCSSTSSLVIRR